MKDPFCYVCEKELTFENTPNSFTIHLRCLDCGILWVINQCGIYTSGYVSQKSDEQKEIAHLARHFIKK